MRHYSDTWWHLVLYLPNTVSLPCSSHSNGVSNNITKLPVLYPDCFPRWTNPHVTGPVCLSPLFKHLQTFHVLCTSPTMQWCPGHSHSQCGFRFQLWSDPHKALLVVFTLKFHPLLHHGISKYTSNCPSWGWWTLCTVCSNPMPKHSQSDSDRQIYIYAVDSGFCR